jgi:hypothetical protein
MSEHNIFTKIYENKLWGDNEENDYKGSSGSGSKLEYNIEYIRFIKEFIKIKNIKSVVDLGSGDWVFSEHIYIDSSVTYTGFDIYEDLVVHNKEKYSDRVHCNFIHLNFFNEKEQLPKADLYIIKDVLQHWKSNDIYTFLDYLTVKQPYKYFLIINCGWQYNEHNDIYNTGDFRPLSCNKYPMKKYNPIKIFNYNTKEVSLITNKNIIEEDVLFTILAKDKANFLPTYLQCLYNQDYPKNKIHLYIRTNDNNDNTEEILRDFINSYGHLYASVFFDSLSINEELKKYKQHEWNVIRFKILGDIRQKSIKYAIERNLHYFIADCDNFIIEKTLTNMMNLKNLNSVISPFLVSNTAYSNYHNKVDGNGYMKHNDLYHNILRKDIKGLIDCDVVHCTYFIPYNLLNFVKYDDNSNRYEYVIFSDVLRKNKILQLLDNMESYGFLTLSDTFEELESEYNSCNWKNLFNIELKR